MAEKSPLQAGASDREEALVIDFLYWEGCASYQQALTLLQSVLDEENVAADVRVRRVDTEEEAISLRFPGSPTIRVSGTDIDEDPARPHGLSCRVYRVEGAMSGVPARDLIVRAIRGAS